MATVGIVGGLGPESTIDYYRRILAAWQQEEPSSAPSIVIDSLDVQRALKLVASDRPALTTTCSRRSSGSPRRGGFRRHDRQHGAHGLRRARGPLARPTDEHRRDLRRRSAAPRLPSRWRCSARASPWRRRSIPWCSARTGSTVVTPKADERAWVHERYVGELLKGDFRDDTRQEFIALVDRLRRDERIDGVILGGTELPLLLRGDAHRRRARAGHHGAARRRDRAASARLALDSAAVAVAGQVNDVKDDVVGRPLAPFAQKDFTSRCEWGSAGDQGPRPCRRPHHRRRVLVHHLRGRRGVARRGHAAVCVAGLGRSCSRRVRDSEWGGAGGQARRRSRYSLAPASYVDAPAGLRVVLPSPNGARLTLAAATALYLSFWRDACAMPVESRLAAAARMGSHVQCDCLRESAGRTTPCVRPSRMRSAPARSSPQLPGDSFAESRGDD